MNQSSSKIIQHKLGLLNLAEELQNVSKACRMMGVSRDTFYRYRDAREQGGVEALFDRPRRVPNPKNRVEPQVEEAVLSFSLEYPAHGQVRVSNDLRKKGIFVSPSGVRSIWLRHTLHSRKLRLRALEKKMAEENLILTEAQIAAMERQKNTDEAHGEIETEHPGYLGSQDTYYVGTIKGIGRIYQQTFVDTYSKVAACKLYTTKTPITSADLLNDRVLPMLEAEGVSGHPIPAMTGRIKTGHFEEVRFPVVGFPFLGDPWKGEATGEPAQCGQSECNHSVSGARVVPSADRPGTRYPSGDRCTLRAPAAGVARTGHFDRRVGGRTGHSDRRVRGPAQLLRTIP